MGINTMPTSFYDSVQRGTVTHTLAYPSLGTERVEHDVGLVARRVARYDSSGCKGLSNAGRPAVQPVR